MTYDSVINEKASLLAQLAGVDVNDYFIEKAKNTSWKQIAKSALSALEVTRKQVDDLSTMW